MNRECQQIRDLMDSYLGGELMVESNHQVLRHMETCDACRTEVERRERTRTLLRQSLDIPLDVGPLRGRINKALDAEQSRWLRVARYWGVAAAMIFGVGLTIWYSRSVDAAAFTDSVDNHVQCALTIPASAVYDANRAAKRLEPPFLDIVQTIRHTYGGYDLVDAHMCPYLGRKYVHLVYRGEGRTLSLFAEEALRGALPGTGSVAPLQGTPLDVHSTAHNGYWVTGTATRQYHIFVVSDDSAEPVTAVANNLLLSAVRFVRTLER